MVLSTRAEYTIESISNFGYHGKGWCLTFDAESDYELVSEDKDKQKENKIEEYPQAVIENAILFLCNRNNGMPVEEARDIVNAVVSVLNPKHWTIKKSERWEIINWLVSNIEKYLNHEYNEFHHQIEYDGTVDVKRLIFDLREKFN